MPRVPRSRGGGEEKYSGAGVSTNPDINTTAVAVQTNSKIDFSHISNILEDAIDVLKNDNTKLAGLITLLKTVLEKAFSCTTILSKYQSVAESS